MRSSYSIITIVDQCVYYIFILTILFGIVLHNILGVKFADEICCLLLVGVFFCYMFQLKDWDINKGFLVTLFVFLFYLIYSLFIHSNSVKGIFYDLVIQMKPYLVFFTVYQILPIFSTKNKSLLKDACLLIWFLCLPFALYGFINPRILSVIWEHPTNYAAVITSLALTYLFLGNYSKKERLIFLLMLSVGLISGRAKFSGFFVLAMFVVLYLNDMKRTELNLKTVLILSGLTIVIAIAAKEKIDLYFLQALSGEEEQLVARAALYFNSLEIFKDYIPFGSGLASYATHASGVFYSEIYNEYNLSSIWGLTKDAPDFITDTYYPSLAQFGIVGFFLYFFFWSFYTFKSYKYMRQTGNIHFFSIFIMIAGYLFIKNIAEASFTSNEGVFTMFLLALSLGSQKRLLITKI